ncbi:MAG: hypothetical protein DI535_21445 [Citrobacter freundii]|nr:MAG: hypothetical protein DI535_21445 [Citrobacter freundii]
MRKCVLIMLMMIPLPLLACDICGAGAGGSYLGLMPSFRKKFFGLRYQHNSLLHHLGPGGSVNYLTTTETYRIAELWGAVNIGSKFRITGFIPYNLIERENQQEHIHDQGLGDITLIGYYQLMNKSASENALKQSLWIGAGTKLPTGKYNPDEKNIQQASQNTFQLGTGSLDFSLNTMYDLQYNNTGVNINAGYKINTANQYEYKYGNKFTANTLLYQRINIVNKVIITPNAGVLFETAAKDKKTKDIQVWETGGYSCTGTIGLEFSTGRFNAGANLQKPFSQHLGEGKLKGQERAMIHFGISI